MMAKGGKSQKANKQQGRPKGVGPMVLIQHIRAIAPMTPLTPSTCIANTQTLSAIDHLRCPICIEILSQPVELPCRAVLCAACIIRWFTLCKYPVSLLLLGDTTRSSTHQSCLQLDFRVATGYHSVLFPLQSGNEGRNTRSAPVFSTAQDSC